MTNYNSITKIMKKPNTLVKISPLQRHCDEKVPTGNGGETAIDNAVRKLISVARDMEQRNYKFKKIKTI